MGVCDKLFFMKMGNNVETVRKVKAIYLPLISFFLGQCAMVRGPAFSERSFKHLFTI